MANRFVLNETSYHGKGAIESIPEEAKARGFKKALVCSDPDLVKFGVTAKVTDLPDYDVDIYVCVISDKDKSNYGSVMFQPDSKERPVTPTPSHTPVVPDVKESVVQGFEKALAVSYTHLTLPTT